MVLGVEVSSFRLLDNVWHWNGDKAVLDFEKHGHISSRPSTLEWFPSEVMQHIRQGAGVMVPLEGVLRCTISSM